MWAFRPWQSPWQARAGQLGLDPCYGVAEPSREGLEIPSRSRRFDVEGQHRRDLAVEQVVAVEAEPARRLARISVGSVMHPGQCHALQAGVIPPIEIGASALGVQEQHGGARAVRQDGRREQGAVPRRDRRGDRHAGRSQVGQERGLSFHVGRATGAVARQAQNEALPFRGDDGVGVVEAAVQERAGRRGRQAITLVDQSRDRHRRSRGVAHEWVVGSIIQGVYIPGLAVERLEMPR